MPVLHVVRPHRHRCGAQEPAVERVDAEHGIVAARDEGAVAHEGDVLRWRIAGDRAHELAAARVVDRDPAPIARRDPDAAAAGREPDVVRKEGRPYRPDDPRVPWLCERQHRERRGFVAERDPQPRAIPVDPEVTCRPVYAHPSDDAASANVDDGDLPPGRVGDVREAPVRRCGGVAGRTKLAGDRANPEVGVDERHPAAGRMGDQGPDPSDALDAAWICRRGEPAEHAPGRDVDGDDARFQIGGDEGQRRSAHGPCERGGNGA